MSLMTEHEVKCMIDDALKAHMDKYVTSCDRTTAIHSQFQS